MTTLIERLRKEAACLAVEWPDLEPEQTLVWQAADTLTAQALEIERLREDAERWQKLMDMIDEGAVYIQRGHGAATPAIITARIDAARAALSANPPEVKL